MASVISQGQLTGLERTQIGGPGGSGSTLLFDGPITSWEDFKAKSAHVLPLTVWGSQPSVRKVVDFIARSVASTPLKVYRRVSDTDRQRVTDHPIARVLALPSAGVIPYRFWHSVIVDWMLFDRWCVMKAANTDPARLVDLVRLPAERTTFADDGLARVEKIWIDSRTPIDPALCLFDHGYSPLGANGTTPMRTLAAILEESREAVEYRRAIWKRGARVPAVITRPAAAPDWSPETRDKFSAQWATYSRGGGSEGGTPILQDGMTLTKVDTFSPKDALDIEGRQLSDAEVASSYHIAPELVGAREGTYSNVDAFRQMLYRDGLGPVYIAWEQVVNAMFVPDLDPSGELYVEADIDAKLRGSFESQAAVLQTSVGAPWLTRNEARARQNLEAVAGGDELVTPLNVLIGGQASPTDSGSQNVAPKAMRRLAKAQHGLVKARTVDGYRSQAEKTLGQFFDRQRAAVLAGLGKKSSPDWWDQAQWDDDLADTLHGLAADVADDIGAKTAAGLGFESSDYDTARTVNFLRTVSSTRAKNINATTLSQIEAALKSDDEDDTPAAVFDAAKSNRGPSIAVQLVTASAAFATTEAARQLGGDKATKTWETGPHPRQSHADMDGQTVGINDAFSNGLNWPGDGGDADEVAGCNCGTSVDIS